MEEPSGCIAENGQALDHRGGQQPLPLVQSAPHPPHRSGVALQGEGALPTRLAPESQHSAQEDQGRERGMAGASQTAGEGPEAQWQRRRRQQQQQRRRLQRRQQQQQPPLSVLPLPAQIPWLAWPLPHQPGSWE